MTVSSDELVESFKTLGLSEQKAKETLKNAVVTKNLGLALHEIRGIVLPQGAGSLIYYVATKIKPQMIDQLPVLVKYIATSKLDTTVRVDAALQFLLSHLNGYQIDDFEKACGIGVVVTPEQIEKAVNTAMLEHKEAILEKRYRFNTGPLMQAVRNSLPWADGRAIKCEIDLQVFDLLGAKTDADLAPLPKADKKVKSTAPADKKLEQKKESEEVDQVGANSIAELMKTKVHFHAPGENYKTDGYVVTPHTHHLLKKHLEETGGRVQTRFPPEPNGILHIGHAKAININFGYAAAHGGLCNLRYDDTNPEKEEEKFFTGIKDMVEWLGYKPDKITHSSDNFDQLYKWAVELIKHDLAYVCHQTSDEMKGFNVEQSPWRNRPIAESLQLFEDMKNGKIDEGKATLRMKTILEEGKVDPVAYRIRFLPHPKTGSKWCIYPTYDYTHCLCDSIENITHSLCTKEFQSRRSSYYWLCNALNIYCPVQWEYGRLSVDYTVVSKRKIAKLISEKIVNDWDDPRLFTLTALRRRGFPAEAVNMFCAQMGVTGAQGSVHPAMLEACVRDVLNNTAPRTMVVLEPLKLILENYPFTEAQSLTVPDFPNDTGKGNHNIVFDKTVYIESSDFTEAPDKGYRRLTPNQGVGLRYTGFVVTVKEIRKDSTGKIVEIVCNCEKSETAPKPKAFIHWVSHPINVTVRLYEMLFKHRNPEEVPDGFISDCRDNTLKELQAMADVSLKTAKVYDKYQFERIGFFSVDPDSTESMTVFNRTVSLKEDSGKS
uniref:glutamine--tRNA ligase n=1 Tax=Xenopsylla cheopis TaxID=163159 RepID=A0A6M2DDE6_XENCH